MNRRNLILDKKEEIEEMEMFILKNRTVEDSEWIARGLYEIGYRKADEVRKETAKEIWEEVKGVCNRVAKYDYRLPNIEPFKNIFKKYGVEVDE